MASQLGEPIPAGLSEPYRMMLISEAASSPCTIALPASGGPSKIPPRPDGPWHSRQFFSYSGAAGSRGLGATACARVVGAAQALQVHGDRAQVFAPEEARAVGDHGIHRTEAAGPRARALAEIVDDVLGLPARRGPASSRARSTANQSRTPPPLTSSLHHGAAERLRGLRSQGPVARRVAGAAVAGALHEVGAAVPFRRARRVRPVGTDDEVQRVPGRHRPAHLERAAILGGHVAARASACAGTRTGRRCRRRTAACRKDRETPGTGACHRRRCLRAARASGPPRSSDPMPVLRSGVMLVEWIVPSGVASERPPANAAPSSRVWQLTQLAAVAT